MAHWGYSAEILERWRDELAVSPSRVREGSTFVAIVGAEIVGFYSLRPSQAVWKLDNLWVLPELIYQGIEHALLSHALATAANGGARELTVDADPNAESFYLECGAIRRGMVPAPMPGQLDRTRPQFAFVQPNNGILNMHDDSDHDAFARGGEWAEAEEMRREEAQFASEVATFEARMDALSPELRQKWVDHLRQLISPAGLVLSDEDERTLANWVEGTLDYRRVRAQLGTRVVDAIVFGKNAI